MYLTFHSEYKYTESWRQPAEVSFLPFAVNVMLNLSNNSPFPSSPKPLHQSEVCCTTIHMKMSLICKWMKSRMSTKTRFEEEVYRNSEMAYSWTDFFRKRSTSLYVTWRYKAWFLPKPFSQNIAFCKMRRSWFKSEHAIQKDVAFLFPVSAVYAKNAWDYDLPLSTKNDLHFNLWFVLSYGSPSNNLKLITLALKEHSQL